MIFRLSLSSICFLSVVAATPTEKLLDLGFAFDYTPTSEPVPIPTTTQCDSLHLSWGRASFTTGPNPVAPYYMQDFRTFLFPSVINAGSDLQFDWPVPYVPGTQYQICMFDSNGVSGGCQRMDTVIPAANSALDDPPVCQNLTFPAGILDVDAQDHTGPLSQYGFVDQCTDISITPKNGTPPFTLTVAPALHPPWNITSNDMSPINWTVQLSWASPFFISLVDANGQTWANGPLHSGGEGPTDCLALGAKESQESGGGPDKKAIGSGIGGLIGGLVVGSLIAWFTLKRRRSTSVIDCNLSISEKEEGRNDGESNNPSYPFAEQAISSFDHAMVPAWVSRWRSRVARIRGSADNVEPFSITAASDDERLPKRGVGRGSIYSDHAPPCQSNRRNTIGTQVTESDRTLTQERAPTTSGQVYVVHHDGGHAPVTVYASEGAEVIELPPRYIPDGPPVEGHQGAGSSSGKGLPVD